jgi:hypothetical protein
MSLPHTTETHHAGVAPGPCAKIRLIDTFLTPSPAVLGELFRTDRHDRFTDDDTRVRARLAAQYCITHIDPTHPFGPGYSAVRVSDEKPAHIVRRMVSREDHDAFVLQWERLRQASNPAVVLPSEWIYLDGLGSLVVFDLPTDRKVLTLRGFIRVMNDPQERAVGFLFAPVVAALRHLEQGGALPDLPRVDSDSAFVFPDSTIRIMHPSFARYDSHRRRYSHARLEKELRKRQLASQAIDRVSNLFIVADLATVLYEIMTRNLTHTSHSSMTADAKKLLKREPPSRFSTETRQLLVDILSAGYESESDICSLADVAAHPTAQRWFGELIRCITTSNELSTEAKSQWTATVNSLRFNVCGEPGFANSFDCSRMKSKSASFFQSLASDVAVPYHYVPNEPFENPPRNAHSHSVKG